MANQSICVALLVLLIGHVLAGKSSDWVSVRMDERRMGKGTYLQKSSSSSIYLKKKKLKDIFIKNMCTVLFVLHDRASGSDLVIF